MRRGRERMKAWFAREVKNSAQFVAFGVLDSKGTMVVNLLGENAPAQFADREYSSITRSHDDDALRIGRPVHSQSNGWLIPVTRRFNKADGSFGGVALAAIDPNYFQEMYDRLDPRQQQRRRPGDERWDASGAAAVRRSQYRP